MQLRRLYTTAKEICILPLWAFTTYSIKKSYTWEIKFDAPLVIIASWRYAVVYCIVQRKPHSHVLLASHQRSLSRWTVSRWRAPKVKLFPLHCNDRFSHQCLLLTLCRGRHSLWSHKRDMCHSHLWSPNGATYFSAYFVTSTLRGILFLSSTSWSFILGDGACREITTKRPVSQRSQYRITTKENCHNITLHSFHFHHLYICTYFYMLLQTCIRHMSKAASRSNNPVNIKQRRNGRIRCDCMDRNDNKVQMRAGQDEKSYKKKRVRKVTKSAR